MEIHEIEKHAKQEIAEAKNAEIVERLRIKYLGRKGELTAVLRTLGERTIEERRELGPKVQALKIELERLLTDRVTRYTLQVTRSHHVDFTAPAKKIARGHLHPLTLVEREIRHIFQNLNFGVVEGPEVETEYYNFDALNIPEGHPARDMWDTFWIRQNEVKSKKEKVKRRDRLLLRTHTSPVQVRYMESHEPPFQIIVPGRVSRYEATDMTHYVHFLNLEGLMVGKHVTLANFKYIIEAFFKKFFGKDIEFRYRPSYFPFVEPGVEVDVKFKGKWLEVMGAGMVHPRVFEAARYNPRDWQGFAFGIGVERLMMIKYGIPDIRLFYSGDLRFIHQF